MDKLGTTVISAGSAEDARRARILEGAMTVFLAYGFQRTTMDDIARAAEISRPALYLVFRNKTDIYRALATEFLQGIIANAREVLASDDPLADRLERSIVCMLDHVIEIEESPHGAEILDMKNSLAGDIVASCRAELLSLVEAAIAKEARSRSVELSALGLSAGILADLLLDAIDGMKMRGLPAQRQREAVHRYTGIVARAIGA
jgi:AcrR family transcriptional regulator